MTNNIFSRYGVLAQPLGNLGFRLENRPSYRGRPENLGPIEGYQELPFPCYLMTLSRTLRPYSVDLLDNVLISSIAPTAIVTTKKTLAFGEDNITIATQSLNEFNALKRVSHLLLLDKNDYSWICAVSRDIVSLNDIKMFWLLSIDQDLDRDHNEALQKRQSEVHKLKNAAFAILSITEETSTDYGISSAMLEHVKSWSEIEAPSSEQRKPGRPCLVRAKGALRKRLMAHHDALRTKRTLEAIHDRHCPLNEKTSKHD